MLSALFIVTLNKTQLWGNLSDAAAELNGLLTLIDSWALLEEVRSKSPGGTQGLDCNEAPPVRMLLLPSSGWNQNSSTVCHRP